LILFSLTAKLILVLRQQIMFRTYRRFFELKKNAINYLNGRGSLEDRLSKAIFEIAYINNNDVPEPVWDKVQSLIDRCSTHKAEGDEGIFMASIRKMSFEEKEALERDIKNL